MLTNGATDETSEPSLDAAQGYDLSSIADIVMVVGSDAEIRFINHTAPGYTTEQVIGHRLSEFVDPRDWRIQQAALDEVFPDGGTASYSLRGTDGTEWWSTLQAAPGSHEGVLVCRDLSGLDGSVATLVDRAREYGTMLGDFEELCDQMREALRESDLEKQALEARLSRAEQSCERLKQFGYIATHDLHEPTRMMGSYAAMLAKRYGGKLDAKATEFLGHLVGGAKRMEAFLSHLAGYIRSEQTPIKFKQTDCNAAYRGAVDNLQLAISEAGAETYCEPLPTLRANQVEVTQLFQNLLANAIKFRKEGTTPQVYVKAEEQPDHYLFSVSDNGIGINPRDNADGERIFLMFQRLHTTDEYEGTGTGLAFCKQIVENHGGRIWVESKPGEGSTFYFTMPKPDSHS